MPAGRALPGERILSRPLALLLAAAVGFAPLAAGAATESETIDLDGPVRFLSPEDGDHLVGPTRIRFAVAPGSRIDRIDVYVDGLFIGSATAPEWSFDWEAPPGLADATIVAGAFAAGDLVEKISIRSAASLGFGDELKVIAVQLYPVVKDRRGGYVRDLTADDFAVFDEGRPVEIESFSTEPADLSLAFLIDVSDSMLGKLSVVQVAASRFVDELDDAHRVAVYAFNHGMARESEFGAAREHSKAQIRGLHSGGGTNLYDAVVEVLAEIAAERGRKAIVLFSDGRDEGSLTTLARAVEAARRSEVILYTVGIGRSSVDLEAREDLRRIASETGGHAYVIEKIRNLPVIFSSILEDLGAQYSLAYTAPAGPPGTRRVVVQPRHGEFEVRYRKVYYYSE